MKLSRPDAIRKMIGQAVENLPDASATFVAMVTAEPGDRPKLLKRLHEIETAADEYNARLLRKVAKTFITPYDREDICNMVDKLDDVIDQLDHAGHLLVGFELDALPEQFAANARELLKMSKRARAAVELIKSPEQMDEALQAMSAHENTLDEGYRSLLVSTFVAGSDPIRDQQIKILAEIVESAATSLDKFGLALAVVTMKAT